MNRLYAILGIILFLFVGYWFVAHSFVIVRLTSAFGLMFFVALVIGFLFWARRLFR